MTEQELFFDNIAERDILSAVCGVDNDGIPKANAVVRTSIDSLNEEGVIIDEEVLDSRLIGGAVVNIQKGTRSTMIDLTFENDQDEDMQELFGQLKSLLDIAKVRNLADNELQDVSLVISSSEFEDFFVVADYAAWAPIASDIRTGTIDTIRFITDNDYFNVMQYTGDMTVAEMVD